MKYKEGNLSLQLNFFIPYSLNITTIDIEAVCSKTSNSNSLNFTLQQINQFQMAQNPPTEQWAQVVEQTGKRE
jgi:hypothetical protein